jgi:uncharacterized protein YbjT (DUF2867 family)
MLALPILIILLACIATTAMSMPKKVVITGAGGQTGQALFRKALACPDEFDPLGLVRTPESKAALVETGIPESKVAVVDVCDADAVKKVAKGCDAFCIATSAKPKPTGEINPETERPVFGFPNGSPEEVDWLGQKNQIDACAPDTHVVVCSSMGGTDPSNPLNALGRTTNPDGTTSGGNILMWKRKAEKYLIDSGRPYTIVHPGGLLNEPGGERELVVGVDDEQVGTDSRTVPREDVAEVMLQAIRHPKIYCNRSFDLRAKPPGDGKPTTDFTTLLDSLDGRNCDYKLGETM